MRPLEICAFSLLAACLLLLFVPAARRPAWARWLPGLAAAFVALQLGLEGHRWQLVGTYPVCVGVVIAAWVGPRPGWHHAITCVLAGIGSLFLVGSALLALGSPMFQLPEPSGPHAVGVVELYVSDPDRPETFTDTPDDHRELMVRVWYPAVAPDSSQEPVAYWEDAALVGPEMARLTRDVLGIGVQDNSFDHYADIDTHSFEGAPLANTAERLPVLVFSHGYGLARPESNTALMEELASRGYWVASIAHTYETPAVVFPESRVVAWDEDAVGSLLSGQDDTFFKSFVASEDPDERDQLVREFLAEQTSTSTSLAVWTADTKTVVDEIEQIASGERQTPFAGRLDLDRLGVLGMSFGGATAGTFCIEDRRCKAGLNLDGFHYGDGMADAVVRVPFMILAARRAEIPINEFFYRHAAGPAYIAVIDESTHMNFTDSSISSVTLRWLGALGPIDGRRMLHILNVYVPAFFDQHLLGQPSALLSGSSADYPEVELMSRNSPNKGN